MPEQIELATRRNNSPNLHRHTGDATSRDNDPPDL
jgi:hypothetical protein